MKKSICLICMFLMIAVSAYSQTINLNPTSSTKADTGDKVFKSRYSIGRSIITGTPLVFKLLTPFPYGTIRDVNFESSSDDCDMYFSEIDVDDETDVNQILWLEGFGDGVRPAFDPVYFANNDTPIANSLYVTIINQSDDRTGVSALTVVYGRRRH